MTSAKESLVQLYELSMRIRLVEERIAAEYPKGEMRCPVHLSIGQEIVSAAVGLNQLSIDTAVSSHRAHAHYLAKGGNLYRMIAEILGKSTGCCKGRGGSMHLIDLEKGFLGSSAIVGNSIPVGVGSAFSHKLDNSGALSFVFFGDGATEEGSFYESVNFAAVNQLPVVFVCENNLYSVYTDLAARQPKDRAIFEMVNAMGVKSLRIDSFDPIACLEKITDAIGDARTNRTPLFLEIPTYRWLEHCGPFDDDALNYRPAGELASFKEQDPVEKLHSELVSTLGVDKGKIESLLRSITDDISHAFDTAKNDPFPTLSESMVDTYA